MAAIFKTNANRFDPYKNFRFKVKIDGNYVMACSKITVLKRSTKVVEFRAGGDPSVIRKSPGQTSYDPITLEAGVTHDPTFEQWANKVWAYSLSTQNDKSDVSLKDFRKDIIIELYNEAGQKAIAYNVYRCWPSAYQALPELTGTGGDTAITLITLENEGWERDTAVAEPTEESYTLPAS
ncbi:MAG TPA: phage tail protein [Candidatus Limnocylindria bacterium]|jgi:phage tail-like protein|nr:phage tail protein [Candidatus Limnocylindria bacterium]